jgi:hypothetical protein
MLFRPKVQFKSKDFCPAGNQFEAGVIAGVADLVPAQGIGAAPNPTRHFLD